MARVAFVKVFTGLNMGVSQLSGELQRAGHDSLIVYFKDYLIAPESEAHLYEHGRHNGSSIGARGIKLRSTLYKKITERELTLLIETLEAFQPDLIGFSMHSQSMYESAFVTDRLHEHFDVPIIWGGSGPTVEPEWSLEHADLVCVGEGEEVIVELAQRLDDGETLSTVAGVWSKAPDGSIVKTAQRKVLDLESIAIPDYDESRCVHIADDRRSVNVYPHSLGSLHWLMTQRGCPFSCSFRSGVSTGWAT